MEMTWAILKMILVLASLLALLFLFARLMKRGRGLNGGGTNDSDIRVLATHCLAPHKYLSLVDVGGEVLALGISESHITLLTRIENREFLEKLSNRAPLTQVVNFPLPSLQPLFSKPKRLKNGWLRWIYGK